VRVQQYLADAVRRGAEDDGRAPHGGDLGHDGAPSQQTATAAATAAPARVANKMGLESPAATAAPARVANKMGLASPATGADAAEQAREQGARDLHERDVERQRRRALLEQQAHRQAEARAQLSPSNGPRPQPTPTPAPGPHTEAQSNYETPAERAWRERIGKPPPWAPASAGAFREKIGKPAAAARTARSAKAM
jgi:hypothetical protein